MKKKHLIFYVDSFLIGGIEKILIEYLKNIDKNIFDITLLIGFDMEELEELKPQIPKHIQIKYLLSKNIFCYYKKKKHLGKLSKLEKIIFEGLSFMKKSFIKKSLLSFIKKEDIIIDFDMTLATYSKKIKNLIITFFHFSPLKYHRGIKSRQKKLGKRLNNYNKIIVISDEMKKEAITLYPNLKNKIIRIYNSLNIENIKNLSKNIKNEDEKYLNDKYILAIGRLEETQKDFTTLIKAYALTVNKIEEKLFIIGKGRHEKNLKNLVHKLNLDNKVIFLGFKSNPYPYIKNCNLFIHSSKFEGLPTVLIEALVLEKIIIATNCPTGPKEILNNGKNGILTEVGNEIELSSAILNILIKKNNNDYYLKNSKNYIKEFDAKYVIKEFEKLILELNLCKV